MRGGASAGPPSPVAGYAVWVNLARSPLLPFLLAGCSDFNLFGKPTEPSDTARPDSGPSCGDLDLPDAGPVGADATCPPTGDDGASNPWSAAISWQAHSLEEDKTATQAAVTPILAQLDSDAALEVLTVAAARFGNDDVGWAVAFDGRTGAEEWAWYGAFPTAALMAADVDGDGAVEVFVEDAAGALQALRGDGTELWTSAATAPPDSGYAIPLNVGDLDDDGEIELLYGRWIVDGRTGAVEVEGPPELDDNGVYLHAAAIADIDLDGSPEIFLDGVVFDGALGRVRSLLGRSDQRMWPVVVQADDDDEGEVGFLYGDGWILTDTDGSVLADVGYRPVVEPGSPCVADFDGDGAAEVAWPNNDTLTMMELDGAVVWTSSVSDTTSAAGCIGFDFDADGAVDIAYGDEVSVAIYSGRTGERMWEASTPHRSWTHTETPAVGDVDADGHADLVFVDNDGNEARPDGWGTPPFLTVVSPSPGYWPSAGTWPLTEYTVTNVLDDGSVPSDPAPSWLSNNTYRARPSPVSSGSADLSVELVGACTSDCESGLLQVSYQVSNLGSVDAPAGAVLTFTVDGVPQTSVDLPGIGAGERLAGATVELALDPTVAVVIGATVAGTAAECESANNSAEMVGPWCP